MGQWVNLLIFALIIMINSGLVVAEVALLTSKKNKLKQKANQGSRSAKKILKLYHNPEKLLSTILIGITAAGVILGALGGDTLSEKLAVYLSSIPVISGYSYIIANAITILGVVYVTVLSELIPKRIAMLHPEKSALVTSYIAIFFYYLFYPIMSLLSSTSNLILRIFRVKEVKQEGSLEELKMLLNQVEGHGSFSAMEADMMKRLLNLGNMQVGAVMTPRSQMVCLDLIDKEEQNRERIINNPFNYFPVTNGGLPNIIGVVSAKQFLDEKFNNKNLQKISQKKSILYVPEMATLTDLIKELRNRQSRIAIVIDEYGEIEGLVTLNDILKTFVGDLATLVEGQKPSIQKRREGYYIINGSVAVEEVMEIMDVEELPGDEEEDYRTLASFILKQLNKVPKANDKFTVMGWTFKVLSMDKFRIAKVAMIKKSK